MRKLFNLFLLMSAIFIITGTDGLGKAVEIAKKNPTEKTIVIIADNTEYEAIAERFTEVSNYLGYEVVNPDISVENHGCKVGIIAHPIGCAEDYDIIRAQNYNIKKSAAVVINEVFGTMEELQKLENDRLKNDLDFLMELTTYDYDLIFNSELLLETKNRLNQESFYRYYKPPVLNSYQARINGKINDNKRSLLHTHIRV